MRQSQSFTKTLKEVPKDEVSANAQLLLRAGYIDKLMAGVYSILPLGFRVYKKIEKIIREEMNLIEGQELFLPSLQPQQPWQETGRWDSMDSILFKFNLNDDKQVTLGPTHEEILAPLAKHFISSYKDLPKYVYQIQNKFRNEPRAKSGLLRGREFIMKDLYSFTRDQKELDVYYERVRVAYEKIFARCGIGEVTYVTYASGGNFSKYSHEFQTLTKAGEDLIYICDKCRVAVNKEILADQKNQCPECGSANLHEEQAAEVGNIFKLGTRFSQAADLYYVDEQGQKQLVVMGSYGIGLQRLMGVIVEVLHDERGIIWPEAVAPYQVHLLGLDLDEDKVNKQADKVYIELIKAGIEVLYDDRKEVRPGEKFAEADLIGIPQRVVISKRTKNQVELKSRGAEKTENLTVSKLIKFLKK